VILAVVDPGEEQWRSLAAIGRGSFAEDDVVVAVVRNNLGRDPVVTLEAATAAQLARSQQWRNSRGLAKGMQASSRHPALNLPEKST
jgi:hypothetical protein